MADQCSGGKVEKGEQVLGYVQEHHGGIVEAASELVNDSGVLGPLHVALAHHLGKGPLGPPTGLQEPTRDSRLSELP